MKNKRKIVNEAKLELCIKTLRNFAVCLGCIYVQGAHLYVANEEVQATATLGTPEVAAPVPLVA